MAYYYVRDDGGSNVGTATGDGGRYASEQTSWPGATSGYYPNIEDANNATTPPAAGDYIIVNLCTIGVITQVNTD